MQQEYFEEDEQEFNLQQYIRRYFRYWYLFPFFIAVCLTGAFFYLQLKQPIFSTKTTLMIKDEKKGLGGSSGDMLSELGGQFGGNKLVENEIEILKSQNLMEQVIKDLSLEVSYSTKVGLKTINLYAASPINITPEIITEYGYQEPMFITMVDSTHFQFTGEEKIYAINQRFTNAWGAFIVTKGINSELKELQILFSNPRNLAESMLSHLTVAQPNVKSTMIELSYEDVSIQRGRDVLNKLLDVYVQSALADKNSEASNTLKFIETRLGLITGELGEVEQDVETYKTSRGLTDISVESELFLENIKENDAKLNQVNTQISILESVDNYIKSAGAGAVAPATYMINDPVLVSLLTKFNELELQRERYARTTTASNPLLETINTQLASTRQAIRENVQNLRRGMDVTKQNLQSINTRFSAGLRSIPQKEREYVGIKRQQTIKENLYLYLLQKREETALAYASTVTDSRLIDAPITTFNPIKPKRSLIWLGSLMAGLAIPLLLINLIFLINNTVQERDDIEKRAHSSILGEIGLMKSTKNPTPTDAIIKMTSRSAVAEQFRALRTNLQYLGDGNCRTILFTSSVGGEGKSFISVNLAASLAFSDKKVVLLGLDMRKPSLQDRLEVSNSRGVSNYLIGQKNLATLIQSTNVHPKFDVITSGPLPPNPSELLTNGRLPELIADLRKTYDYVLIDSPPYGLVTDAALIGEFVDASLYVVRFNYTLLDHLKRIGELSKSKRFKNMSVVFNGVNYGAGYGYGYGYGGYGYGYYTEDQVQAKTKLLSWTRLKKLTGIS